ncbi:MAG: hypothetical protein LQ346_005360 [Caloplaca aetnensis]|nr:MAG: hypothetical protein LQ346_005360 [Caloplaca aetnensis]
MADAAPPIAQDAKAVMIKSPDATPTRSPSKRSIMITQGQKQALIDNLQLEITERARKLRAQYALQAQSLRTRVEMRVNRIPTAMRKANMGELYEKYLESTKQPSISESTDDTPSTTVQPPKQHPSPTKPTVPSPSKQPEIAAPKRGTKRPSNHFSADDDKENTPDPTHPLSTKKRPKPNNAHPSAVLSPKSSNARHQSPIRPQLGSPQKSHLSHPMSPLKPSAAFAPPKITSPAKAAAVIATTAAATATAPPSVVSEKPRAARTRAAATRTAKAPRTTAGSKSKAAPVTRARRGAEPPVEVVRNESRTVSAASNTSTGTTVVRKVGRAAGTGSATAAKGKGKVGGKKSAAAAPAAVEAPAQGRRVLRKRG